MARPPARPAEQTMTRPAEPPRPDSQQRFRARQAAARRADRARWTRPLLALLVIALLAGLAGWIVGWSSWLTARKVSVVGVHRLTAEQVRAVAATPLDIPLARVDLAAIEARVATLPAVRDVVVSRSWPHTVRITVDERRPAVAVPEQSGYLLVDFDAVGFETVGAVPTGVPRLRADPSGLQAGTVRAVVTILEAVPRSVATKIAEVVATSTADVTLVLRDGTRIIWGSAADSTRKSEVLAVLLHRSAQVYDVSAPDAPATRGGP
ncbi:MAG: FtsQ-type POTRA domain-containing protein [Sporichthyaceae bacterium]|nr:FtsQ-type POTRA domain-containing protein [Sporichthyaceae bacterium]